MLCERQELAGCVADALALLPESLRVVLVLRHYERLSFEEVARLTGSPASTVKSRIRYSFGQAARTFTENRLGPRGDCLMNCTDVKAQLPFLFSQVAEQAEDPELRAHLATCPSCRQELLAFEQLGQLLEANPEPPVVVDLASLYRHAALQEAAPAGAGGGLVSRRRCCS